MHTAASRTAAAGLAARGSHAVTVVRRTMGAGRLAIKLCRPGVHLMAVADDVPGPMMAAVIRHMAEYHRGPEIAACVAPYCDGADTYRPARDCPRAVSATGA